MISVVIPAYNNPAEVNTLLESISQRCSQANRFEVIVVDDGSADDRLRDVCAPYSFVRHLRLPENQGAAAARNAGVKATTSDLVLFLDSDMVVLTDVIDLALRMFQDPQVDALVGAVSPQPMNSGSFKRFWALMKAFSLPKSEYSSTFYPMLGVIRRATFNAAGGFNERIRGASIEDYEFSIRLEAIRCRVHYRPELLVGTHYKGIFKSLAQSFSRSAKWLLLCWERRRQFDNHTTTASQAAGVLCGAVVVGSGLLAVLGVGSLMLTAGVLAVYLYLNGRFFLYARSIVGAWFVPVAVCFHLMLSVVVTAGAAWGAAQLLLWGSYQRF